MRLSRFTTDPLTGLVALPFVVAWALAPALVFVASRPRPDRRTVALTEDEAIRLRLIARRTWRFFERFVTPEDNMLPPDNYQEPPQPAIAHRTSPTNIGLYLLSVVSARDFGWIGLSDMLGRLEATFATMGRMHRFRGHFYNWYDTADLRPLDPQYVSTVDSGNLAGHLIALANACEEAIDDPLLGRRARVGIADHLRLLREVPSDPADTEWHTTLDAMSAALDADEFPSIGSAALLAELQVLADRLAALARRRAADPAAVWADATAAAVASHLRDAQLQSQHGHGDDMSPAGLVAALAGHLPGDPGAGSAALLPNPADAIDASAVDLVRRLRAVAENARTIATSTDFRFLYDQERQLLSIGYLPSDGQRDSELLRPPCLRGAPRQLLRHRQGRHSDQALVPARADNHRWSRAGRRSCLGRDRCSST